MATATHRRLERLRHAHTHRVLRGRRRHLLQAAQAPAGGCPACGGHGAGDGCWWCGEPEPDQTPALGLAAWAVGQESV